MATGNEEIRGETPPPRMEEEQKHLTQRILQLTLEIVYLMTGENYVAFKLCNSLVAPSLKETHCAITEAPPPSLKRERRSNKKVQDVTKEIIELLIGEEPCDPYKAVMMEDPPSLPPPDGSIKTNQPENCPLPLYTQDSTQEEHNIQWPYQHMEALSEACASVEEKQANVQMKEEISPQISSDGSRKRNPQKRSSRPLYCQDPAQEELRIPQNYQEDVLNGVEIKEEDEEVDVRTGEWCEEEDLLQISTVSVDSFNNYHVFREAEEDNPVKSEMKAKQYVRGDERCAEEEMHPDVSTDGHHWRDNMEGLHFFISPEGKIEAEKNGGTSLSPDLHPVPYQEALISDPSSHDSGGSMAIQRTIRSEAEHDRPVRIMMSYEEESCMRSDGKFVEEEFSQEISTDGTYRRNNMEDDMVICCDGQTEGETAKIYFSGETSAISDLQPVPLTSDLSSNRNSFFDSSNLNAVHKSRRRFPGSKGSKGGGSKKQKAKFLSQKRIQAKNMSFICSKCGKGFNVKEDFLKHLQFHTGRRLYFCSYCRKPFLGKFRLERHELIHTGQKPYSCEICGIHFSQKANLARHERIHTGEKPYPCPTCGKPYTRKDRMLKHWQSHT